MSYEIAVAVGLSAISFILIYLALNLKKHEAIQLLFLFLGLYTIIAELSILTEFLVTGGQTALANIVGTLMGVCMWSTIIFLAYILIKFIIEVLNIMLMK